MSLFEEQLDKYAALAVHTGVNIQPGQTLVIFTPIVAADFVRKITKKAYEAGARNVIVEWNDDEITHAKYSHAPEEVFSEYPAWMAQIRNDLVKEGAAFLNVLAPNPDLLSDIDPKRIATANKTAAQALEVYRSYAMTDKVCWSIVAVPSEAWAAKIFPEEQDSAVAIQKLWDVIFSIVRVDQADPVQAWKEHNEKLQNMSAYLNEKQYAELVYESTGTNLTVGLPENHIWAGGGATSQSGTRFSPNMPTEEVFTMPHKDRVNGVVSSTKPLNYGGTVIDRFTLTFKDGKVVDFTAEQGYETLKHLIETDEGSSRLGEVALVPYESPISLSNLIFYNTLFDENASCHFALGRAYPTNIQGGVEMSEEELAKNGVNSSLTHVDYMIGSAETNIDGITKDGKREPIFRNGNWAI
ncbi:aminopeptidase [Paenibacillus albiflavus]|uniref:Aminopeptidase n=1 Tax=Paenibacillus albiflavus TaxID=2545760 RepID=A0A4R4EHX3_9BACL|nr:aminopeptidase [Paenibacillus albiflavus]TCZ78800.1 aminopeptidase [Paenibacillus albiflavus]